MCSVAVLLIGLLLWFLRRSIKWDAHIDQDTAQQALYIKLAQDIQQTQRDVSAVRATVENCWNMILHDNREQSLHWEHHSPLQLKEGIQCSVSESIRNALSFYKPAGSLDMLNYLISKVGMNELSQNARDNNMNLFEFLSYLEERGI